MGIIEDAVSACLEESRDSKAPGVFVESYFRQLAKQPGWVDRDISIARRRALDELLSQIKARHPTAFAGTCSSGSQMMCA